MATEKKVMPHNVESEQSILGCALIDNEAVVTIMGDLKDKDFYVEAHKIIFRAMQNIYASNRPIDFITLTDELEKANMLDSVGGVDYISTLTTIVPSASNHKHYIDIIKRNSVLRQLISASNDIIVKAYEGQDKDEAIQFAEKNIYTISQEEERSSLVPLRDSLSGVMDKFEEIQKNAGAIAGISTGLYGLDKILNGLHKSDLILVAARPGCGKTSLAMNIVNYAAIHEKSKVAVFSLEMGKDQLAQRSLCSVAYVDMGKALRGELSVDEWKALWAANEKLSQANIFVDDSALNTPMDILSKCRRLQREQGLDLIMIDYLQLMKSNSKSSDGNRQQEVGDLTRNLKIMARELDVPVIVLSQLSRAPEQRKGDHRPMLSDLRESGSIEQDADIVLFIYRPDMYNDVPEIERGQDIAEIIVAKHRNGGTGTVKTKWNGSTTTFINLEKDSNSQSLEKTMPKAKKNDSLDQLEDLPEIVPIDQSDIDDIF